MANRTKILIALLSILFVIGFTFSALSSVDRITSARSSTRKYAEALTKLPNDEKNLDELRNRLDELQKSETSQTTQVAVSTTDIADYVRSSLLRNGIRPARMQVSGNAPRETIEFTFRCEPIKLFTFLKYEDEHASRFAYSYISIMPVSSSASVDVVMKVEHED